MPPLTLGRRHLPGITIISLTGELDASDAEHLRAYIQQARRTPADELIFDLAGLAFIDSTGLRVLLDAYSASWPRLPAGTQCWLIDRVPCWKGDVVLICR
jgi:anti-anti-sigma factor